MLIFLRERKNNDRKEVLMKAIDTNEAVSRHFSTTFDENFWFEYWETFSRISSQIAPQSSL